MALLQIYNECIKDFYLTQWESRWDKTTESKPKKHLHISNGEVNSQVAANVAFWTVGKGVLCNSNLIELVWLSLDVVFTLLNGYLNVRVPGQQDDREGGGTGQANLKTWVRFLCPTVKGKNWFPRDVFLLPYKYHIDVHTHTYERMHAQTHTHHYHQQHTTT